MQLNSEIESVRAAHVITNFAVEVGAAHMTFPTAMRLGSDRHDFKAKRGRNDKRYSNPMQTAFDFSEDEGKAYNKRGRQQRWLLGAYMHKLAILWTAGLFLMVVSSAAAQTATTFQSSPRVDVRKPTAPSELGKGQYLLSVYHVIGHDNPQGCTNAGWDCMTNLCRAELGPAAGRSEAGCRSDGSQWQCTFNCVIYHPVIP